MEQSEAGRNVRFEIWIDLWGIFPPKFFPAKDCEGSTFEQNELQFRLYTLHKAPECFEVAVRDWSEPSCCQKFC